MIGVLGRARRHGNLGAGGCRLRVATGLRCTKIDLQPIGRQMLAVSDHLASADSYAWPSRNWLS